MATLTGSDLTEDRIVERCYRVERPTLATSATAQPLGTPVAP